MPSGRLLPLLVLAVALPQTATAAEPYTTKAVKVTASVGPAGDQKCVVDADLYTPTGVDAAHPAAAVLTTNGFGGNKGGQATLAKSYATRGYVVLSYSGLGFGNSGCKIQLDHPDWDGKAA